MGFWFKSKWRKVLDTQEDILDSTMKIEENYRFISKRLTIIQDLFEERENNNKNEIDYLKEELRRKTLLIEELFSNIVKTKDISGLNGIDKTEYKPKTAIEAYKSFKDRDKKILPLP